MIYFDETVFHTWGIRDKSWSRIDEPNEHVLNRSRESVTVFGALSGNALQTPAVYQLGRSTNRHDVEAFLRRVASHVRADVHKPFLLYDSHRSHLSRNVQAVIR